MYVNIDDKIKNNMLNEANIELLNIKKNILKYINDIRDHHTKKIDNNENKKIRNIQEI